MTDRRIFSIGHSNHSVERFLKLIAESGITAVADVRSSPTSRHQPQFNLDNLRAVLRENSCAYVFLGKELGGRPRDRRLYTNGIADYEKMAQSREFVAGMTRLLEGAKAHRIAVLCSEHDPLDCHRCLLVARQLRDHDLDTTHILSSGHYLSHGEVESRLLQLEQHDKTDLFLSDQERLAQAYKSRARKIAYREYPGQSAAE